VFWKTRWRAVIQGGLGRVAFNRGLKIRDCESRRGARVRAWAGVWYAGRVSKFDARSKKYTVEFEDGDTQETRIPDKDVRVLPDKGGGSKKKDGKKPRTAGTALTIS